MSKVFWQQRSKREQVSLLLVGLLITAVLLYSTLLLPWYNTIADWRNQARTEKALLTNLAILQNDISHFQQAGYRWHTNATSLTKTINETLTNAKLISHAVLTPLPHDQYQVELNQVSYEAVIGWLTSLTQQYALAVSSASMSKTTIIGTVNATFLLQREIKK